MHNRMWCCIHFSPPGFFFWLRQSKPRLSPYASSGKTSADARHAAVGESAERPCLPAPGHGCAKTAPARSTNVAKWVSRAPGGSRLLGAVQFVGTNGGETGAKRRRDNSGDLKGTDGPPGCCSPGIFSGEESLCIEPAAYAPSQARNRTHAAGDTQYASFNSPGSDSPASVKTGEASTGCAGGRRRAQPGRGAPSVRQRLH